MIRKAPLALAAAMLMTLAAPLAAADSLSHDVKAINDGWAHISYEVKGSSTQTKALDRLAQQAAALVQKYPGKAEPLVWQGVVISEQANRANIFHKLGLATRARDILTRAYAIDPKAAGGGAAMSLGVLYYKVPGWPVGFGDKQKAQELLKKALAINPSGIDPNYFYADYLVQTGSGADAVPYLERALAAPPRAGRQLADEGRRGEARQLLERVRSH